MLADKMESQMKLNKDQNEDLEARSAALSQSLLELAAQAKEHASEKQQRQSELSAVLGALQDSEQELITLRRTVEEHGSRESEARHKLQLIEAELRDAEERLLAARDGAAAAADQAETAAGSRDEARQALEELRMRLQLEEAEAKASAFGVEEAAAMKAKELQKLSQVCIVSFDLRGGVNRDVAWG